ncbi:Zinc finger CCCH domain-containing protein 36 [Camellia lanceoleosa]|uniref:Zinc finger CCCH domain-containing protein 36 n=1 Tax=Camellia lanceoleosa TaxID=1840588 RepID=A0ACC0G770_9ERIC|nr:Zinc finger CCCH domain-containing protein 36 [Camellia lanceoleosa]
MDTRKRARPIARFNSNGGVKKSKQEIDSLSSGIGSKSKPCMTFFSTAGCPFGENYHFLHYVPGGYNAIAQMMNLAPAPVSRNMAAPPPIPDGSSPSSVKTRMRNKYIFIASLVTNAILPMVSGNLASFVAPSQDDSRAMELF